MIKYNANSADIKTNEAVTEVNDMMVGEFARHYTQPVFRDFTPDMADVDLMNIMLLIKAYVYTGSIEVKKWYPRWKWTKAIAMSDCNDIW
jgi:hypothetical protein